MNLKGSFVNGDRINALNNLAFLEPLDFMLPSKESSSIGNAVCLLNSVGLGDAVNLSNSVGLRDVVDLRNSFGLGDVAGLRNSVGLGNSGKLGDIVDLGDSAGLGNSVGLGNTSRLCELISLFEFFPSKSDHSRYFKFFFFNMKQNLNIWSFHVLTRNQILYIALTYTTT